MNKKIIFEREREKRKEKHQTIITTDFNLIKVRSRDSHRLAFDTLPIPSGETTKPFRGSARNERNR